MTEIKLTGWSGSITGWPDLSYWLTVFGITFTVMVLIWLVLKISIYYMKKYSFTKVCRITVISLIAFFPSYFLLSSHFWLHTTQWQEKNIDYSGCSTAGSFPVKYACESIGLSVLDLDKKYPGFSDKILEDLAKTGLFRKIYPVEKSASWMSFGDVEMVLTVSLEQSGIEAENLVARTALYELNYQLEPGVRTDYFNQMAPYSLIMPKISEKLRGKAKISGLFNDEKAKAELNQRILDSFSNHFTTHFCQKNRVSTGRFQTKIEVTSNSDKFLSTGLKIPEEWQLLRQYELPGVMYTKRQHNRFLVQYPGKDAFFEKVKKFVFENGFGFEEKYQVKEGIKLKPEEISIDRMHMLFGRAFYTADLSRMMRIKYTKVKELKFNYGNENLIDDQDYFLTVAVFDLVERDKWGKRITKLISQCQKKSRDKLLYSLAHTYIKDTKKIRKKVMDELVEKQPDNINILLAQADLAEGEERLDLKKKVLNRIENQSRFYGRVLDLQTEIEKCQKSLQEKQ